MSSSLAFHRRMSTCGSLAVAVTRTPPLQRRINLLRVQLHASSLGTLLNSVAIGAMIPSLTAHLTPCLLRRNRVPLCAGSVPVVHTTRRGIPDAPGVAPCMHAAFYCSAHPSSRASTIHGSYGIACHTCATLAHICRASHIPHNLTPRLPFATTWPPVRALASCAQTYDTPTFPQQIHLLLPPHPRPRCRPPLFVMLFVIRHGARPCRMSTTHC
jgi:hypothetical protein